MLGASFITKALAWIFIAALDTVAYLLLAAAYTIFLAVSQLDLFSTESGGKLYSEIISRFYTALSIIMVFVFAYYLIMMIIDPDGDKKKASTQLVKDIVFSLVLVIILPTIFGYMSLFQKHVLTNNTIGALILGANGTIDDNPGKQISMIVFTAFYHPQGTMYSDYFGNDGLMIDKDDAFDICKGPHTVNGESVSTSDKVCNAWVDGLEKWENSDGWGINAISGPAAMRDTVGDDDGMEYLWILSTAAAIAVAYFFFSYTLDVGTRAVKLGFLQIIAPVPVMLKMFPATKQTYESWFAEIKKSYLEIFIRLAVIFFIVKLCTMVPEFIGVIFDANNNVDGGFLLKAIATVCLILGLLKFAKEAPGLFKTIFSSGKLGGMLAGVDLKPGVKRRISENDYAMKGMSTVTGAVGGMIGTGAMAYREHLKKSEVQGSLDASAHMGAGLHAILSVPRGVISGGKRGYQTTPQEFSAKNLLGSVNQGAAGGQASYQHHENSKTFNLQQATIDARKKHTTVREQLIHQAGDKITTVGDDMMESIRDEIGVLTGTSGNAQAAVTTINQATSSIDQILNLTSSATKPYDEAFEALRKKILSGETVSYDGADYKPNHKQYDDQAYKDACAREGVTGTSVRNSAGQYYNPETKRYEAGFDPRTAAKYQSTDLAMLEKKFTAQKNEKAKSTINSKYKEGSATISANLREQLSREIGNLGSDVIREIDTKIKVQTGDQSATLDSFLKGLTDKNHDWKESDISTLKTIKAELDKTGKNISIQSQVQQQQQKTKNGPGDNKPPKGGSGS